VSALRLGAHAGAPLQTVSFSYFYERNLVLWVRDDFFAGKNGRGQSWGCKTRGNLRKCQATTPTAFVPVVKAVTPSLGETTRELVVTFSRDGAVKSLGLNQPPKSPAAPSG